MEPRLKAEIWVKAHLRRLSVHGIPAVVARRGDSSAGAVLIKVNRLEQGSVVLAPMTRLDGRRAWLSATGAAPVAETEADAYIARQVRTDPDLWVLEIEDRAGRHLLDEPVE